MQSLLWQSVQLAMCTHWQKIVDGNACMHAVDTGIVRCRPTTTTTWQCVGLRRCCRATAGAPVRRLHLQLAGIGVAANGDGDGKLSREDRQGTKLA